MKRNRIIREPSLSRLDADFFSVEQHDEGKYVHVHGYAYYNGECLEEEKPYRGVEFRHFYIPINKFPDDWQDEYDHLTEICSQDIVDLSARECSRYLRDYWGESIISGSADYGRQPKPLRYKQINADTPVGFYIDL